MEQIRMPLGEEQPVVPRVLESDLVYVGRRTHSQRHGVGVVGTWVPMGFKKCSE